VSTEEAPAVLKTVENGSEPRIGAGLPGPGRPRGLRNKRNRLLDEALDKEEQSIIDKLIDKARSGDLSAIGIIADYRWAKFKVQSAPIELPAIIGKTLAEQAKCVTEALAQGELSTDEATAIMGVMTAQARIIEVDELMRRIETLEKRTGVANAVT